MYRFIGCGQTKILVSVLLDDLILRGCFIFFFCVCVCRLLYLKGCETPLHVRRRLLPPLKNGTWAANFVLPIQTPTVFSDICAFSWDECKPKRLNWCCNSPSTCMVLQEIVTHYSLQYLLICMRMVLLTVLATPSLKLPHLGGKQCSRVCFQGVPPL